MKIRKGMVRSAGRQRGFTLIELLIVVVIIGIIATLIIPMFLDALQKSKQKRTMAEMRLVGTCWMSWLTDQISSAAGSTIRQYDLSRLRLIAAEDVLKSLFKSQRFFYCSEVPKLDAWGYDYEYFIHPTSLVTVNVIAIRSRGRDAIFEDLVYDIGPYVATDYDEDMVWADGMFVSYPAGLAVIRAGAGLP